MRLLLPLPVIRERAGERAVFPPLPRGEGRGEGLAVGSFSSFHLSKSVAATPASPAFLPLRLSATQASQLQEFVPSVGICFVLRISSFVLPRSGVSCFGLRHSCFRAA